MHFKPTLCAHFTSCHPPDVRKGFIKGEAFRPPRINSSKPTSVWRKQLIQTQTARERLSRWPSRKYSLTNWIKHWGFRLYKFNKKCAKNCCSLLQNIAHLCLILCILKCKWHLIENQPLLREIYKNPALLSSKKGGLSKTCSFEQSFKG